MPTQSWLTSPHSSNMANLTSRTAAQCNLNSSKVNRSPNPRAVNLESTPFLTRALCKMAAPLDNKSPTVRVYLPTWSHVGKILNFVSYTSVAVKAVQGHVFSEVSGKNVAVSFMTGLGDESFLMFVDYSVNKLVTWEGI